MTDSATTSADRPDRRSILKGLAIASVAVPFAAACSSSNSGTGDAGTTPPAGGGGGGSSPGTSSPTTASGGSTADVITASADVPVGGGVIVADKGIVVTQPAKGTFEGFSNICTHQGCPVANVTNGTINCTCHGSMYSIKDGKVVAGPAPKPLPKKPVKVEGADIVAG
ncbi:MAG: Rieske (2Fe-2S) protein [Nocardioidaceae bacterium]